MKPIFVNPASINKPTVNVSHHAVERFLQRTTDPTKPKDPKATIQKLFNKACEITFKDEFQFRRLLNNNVVQAKYYHNSGWVFVYLPEQHLILTVEQLKGKRFGIEVFKTSETIQAERKVDQEKENRTQAYIKQRDKYLMK